MLRSLQEAAVRLRYLTDSSIETPSQGPVIEPMYSDPRIERLIKTESRDDSKMGQGDDLISSYKTGSSQGVQDEHRIFSSILSAAVSLRISSEAYGTSPMQLDIINGLVLSVLRWIYRDSWSKNRAEILEFHRLERTTEWTVIVAGRRVGKSAASAAALAAILSFIKGPFYIRIYAQNLAIAKEMLDDIERHIRSIPNRTNDIEQYQKGGLRPFIHLCDPTRPGEPILVVAYPSGSNNNRGGKNPHAVIVDEGSDPDPVSCFPARLCMSAHIHLSASSGREGLYDEDRSLALAANKKHELRVDQLAPESASVHHYTGAKPPSPDHLRKVLSMHHRGPEMPHLHAPRRRGLPSRGRYATRVVRSRTRQHSTTALLE